MSGIAGIIHFDGAPVDPGLIRKMTAAMPYRGPDGINHWVRGSVAFGQCMLCTTPESLEETQPLTNEDESLVLVMDGRVDNRDELKQELRSRGIRLRNDTDAEIVLRAFEVWGESSPQRIVGDFSYVIWNSVSNKLFCARDVMGVRPFYYYDGGDFLLIASELHALFSDVRVPREPNLGMVAEYLAAELVTREESLFVGIKRLAPGHVLHLENGHVELRRYWFPNNQSILQYSSEEEYVDHLIDVLKTSLKSKLRSIGTIGVSMSGGLDSTTVFGLAKTMMASGEADMTQIDTFSTIFPGEACDETDYIRQVNDYWGVTGSYINRWIAPPQHYIDHARHYLNCPSSPNGAMNTPLKERVREKGVRVLLTGCGGDEWFCGRDVVFADLLNAFKIAELMSYLRTDERQLRNKIKTFLRYGMLPILPNSLQRAVDKLHHRQKSYHWITKGLLEKSSLEDRIRTASVDKLNFNTYDQEEVYRVGTNAWMVENAEIEDLTTAKYGIEKRHPLWDRRIIEFGLSLPGTLRWQPPYDKYILRQAAHSLMPETVRLRQDKTVFDSLFSVALERQGGQKRMNLLSLADVGWVDAESVAEMVKCVISGDQVHPDCQSGGVIWPTWMIYTMDIWLKETF